MTQPTDSTYPDRSMSAEQDRPLISVVIACVNGTPFILECLDHLTRQEGDVSFEVIVVDCCGSAVRSYDWALYFCEYGFYMPPQPRGATNAVSGINVAYRRQLLDQCADVWRYEFRENEVNDALRSFGHALFLEPDAWVESHLEMSLPYALDHPYQGGRHFGGYRRRRSTVLRRWIWVATSPAVFVVLLGRLVRRVMGRDPSKLGALILSIPYMICLLAAWSVGETAGYVRGGDPRRLKFAARGDAPEAWHEDRN